MRAPAGTVSRAFVARPWAWLLLALLAVSVAAWLLPAPASGPTARISLTAGYPATTRARLAQLLALELRDAGIEVTEIEGENTRRELARVDAGEVDFAMVSGAFYSGAFPNVREVAPLFPEALHLLVKREHVARIGANLGGLRGLRVDHGPRGSVTESLAASVLAFAGVSCVPVAVPGECTRLNLELPEIDRLAAAGERDALPDALFHLAPLPSLQVSLLVGEADYDLVEIPFAPAYRLGSVLEGFDGIQRTGEISRRFTQHMEIPPFTYRTDPAVPDSAVSTIGARLLLVANADVDAGTVQSVLEAVFDSRFSHVPQPGLDRSLLELQPRYPLHPGTFAYLRAHRPWVSGSDVDGLANALSVLGALLGAGLFLRQAWLQRRVARQEALVADYQLRIAALEGRLVEVELAAELDLESLIAIQRDLLRLKGEVIAQYSAGELGRQTTLGDLLSPLNAARDNIAALMLHVRENLEQRAESEGRSSEELWAEAREQGAVQAPAPGDQAGSTSTRQS